MRCQLHPNKTSGRKWVTKQENLLKWIINRRFLKCLFIADCSLCLIVFAVSPQECVVEKEEGEQEEACSQETWYKLRLPEETHFWVSTQRNTTDPFSQQKTHLIAVCGTAAKEEASGNLCSKDPRGDMVSQALDIETWDGEISTVWASVYDSPMTLQLKY